MEHLPSNRHILTALITSLTSIPSPPEPSPTPLQSIPESHHNLLLTLHVLFPNHLLPALDLLDRQLVTRIRLESNTEDESPSDKFLVKSLASTIPRRNRHSHAPPSTTRYLVHLEPWNCSCPSFKLEAFPAFTASDSQNKSKEDEVAGWSFGGSSFDGSGALANDVPCCKHLLACLLADRWPGMLGGFLHERIVTREEMAGIISDI